MKKLKTIKQQLEKLGPWQVFFLVLVIISTVFVVKWFGKSYQTRTIKVEVVGKGWGDNFYNDLGFRPPFWLADEIELGDKQIFSDGGKTAEVVGIEKYERESGSFDVYLTLEVRGYLNTRTNQFVFDGEILEVGKEIKLHLGNALVLGQVVDDQAGDEEIKEIVVTARARGLTDELANQVLPGLKVIDYGSNKPIAEILKVERFNASSELSFSKIRNLRQDLIREIYFDTNSRDLVLSIKLVVEEKNGLSYFAGNQRVKAGENLWLAFREINLDEVEIETIVK